MDIHEYNKTFYYGLSSLFFLAIISLLTYLFKYKNIQIFINLFIIFIILLLTIYCSTLFKDNVIEDFDNSNFAATYTDILDTNILDITVPIADEPFGRLSLSFVNQNNGFNFYDPNNGAEACFTNLYNRGFRGFHFYVEYPLNSSEPYCVFPYKDNAGMNTISTRSKKFPFSDVIDKFRDAFIQSDTRFINGHGLIYLCITCLSNQQENKDNKINDKLTQITNNRKDNQNDTFRQLQNRNSVIVTLGTYDNIPLTKNYFSTHYFIKETDLKYAPFHVTNDFGLYLPLLKYTKSEQDTFNSRGYDEDIQQSINLAYLNGVQFVCIPPTKAKGIVYIDPSGGYDYPTSVQACETYFTDISTSQITVYKKRQSGFITTLSNIQEDINNNSSRIDIIDVSINRFIDASLNTISNDVSNNSYDIVRLENDLSDNNYLSADYFS